MKSSPIDSITQTEIFNAFWERSFEGLVVIDKDRTVCMTNSSAEKLLGYAAGKLTGKNIDNILSPKQAERFNAVCKDFFSKELNDNGVQLSCFFLKKDKSEISVDVSVSNHIHSKKGPLIILLFTDVSERTRAVDEVLKEKNLYVDVLENLTDAFISFNRDWQFTYINAAAFQLLGPVKLNKSFIGQVLWDIVPEIKGSIFETNYRQVMRTGKSIVFEASSLFSDKWMEVRVSSHNNGIAAIFRDITEKKKQIEELAKSEERFSKAFHSSPISLAITQLENGQYKEVNENFLQIFEYEKGEVIGKTPFDLKMYQHASPHSREKFVAELRKNGFIHNREYTFSKSSGEPIQILLSSEVIEVDSKDYILSSMLDITEKKKNEETIAKQNESLEKKVRERTYELTQALEREKENNDLKSRFVTMASHEFRTPLASLLSSVNILEQYTKANTNEKLAKHFNRIKSSVRNLTEILSDFLSLEKIEKGKMEIMNSSFSLPDLMEKIVDETKGSLKEGQTISFTHSGNVGIYQDKKIVHNSLLNLISNASKYSSEGKPIEVISTIKEGNVIILVKDYGIGIPEKDQKNMFTLFFRAGNSGTIQGTGLGLNIVKKYMELIGGTVRFTSQENKETVFTIAFPQIAKLSQ